MARAPFLPLVADASGLDAFPQESSALKARMAEVFGVDEACVLPLQGLTQAINLILRRVAHDGAANIVAPDAPDFRQLAKINRLHIVAAPNTQTDAVFIASPSAEESTVMTRDQVLSRGAVLRPSLLVLDESLIDFEVAPSVISCIGEIDNLVVLRSLSFAYGLAGAPCAALIASPLLIGALRELQEPEPLPTPIVRLALSVLEPSRVLANRERIAEIRTERDRVVSALPNAAPGGGPFVLVSPADAATAREAVKRYGVEGEWRDDATFLLRVGAPEANDRALAAFGAPASTQRRRAEVVRETKETRITVRVDLDREGPCTVDTGIGFFDHMLAQVATHGRFSLSLICAGDLEVDGHHTIEDCALALGQALTQALGARRGIARFGFLLPMDEAEARVSVDLGGRPYSVFEGAFSASHLGAYPTEMTEHVFRSLAQSMGAAIHVSVTGANDHHKTEACYKAFGRALAQAVRVEGEALPSTKGAI